MVLLFDIALIVSVLLIGGVVTRIFLLMRASQPVGLLPKPKPWSNQALNDLGWWQSLSWSGVGSLPSASELRQVSADPAVTTNRRQQNRLRLLASTSAYVSYRYSAQGGLANQRSILLKTSHKRIEVTIAESPFATLQGFIGPFGSLRGNSTTVTIDGSPFGLLQRHGNEIALLGTDEVPLGSWRVIGAESASAAPSRWLPYGKIRVRSRQVGELLQLRHWTPLQLMIGVGVPLLRNVPTALNAEEETVLLSFVALYCLGARNALLSA